MKNIYKFEKKVKMKKFFVYLSVLVMFSAVLVSCENDRDNNDETKTLPKEQPMPM